MGSRPPSFSQVSQTSSDTLTNGQRTQSEEVRSREMRSRRADLPTMYDLPSEAPEEPGLPDEYHDLQPQLLSRTLHLSQYARREWFTGSDLNLYYDESHLQWHKRPDWFLAVGVSRLYDGEDLRRSYVVWQEGKSPDVVVEFLSAGTAGEDLGRFVDQARRADSGEDDVETPGLVEAERGKAKESQKPPRKFEVYERYLRVPHYIVYSRYTRRLRYFRWIDGEYQEQPLRPTNPLIWLDDLAIGLGIWQGEFDEVAGDWLRWCDASGDWFLTDTEQERRAKNQERRARNQERRAREEAEAQVLQTAQNLLATGMDVAQVVQVCHLTEAQRVKLQLPD
ncbi:Uma2 family endonuclease [Vasconcelosia minhoensis]|nr:Uma2 family endonuclease [Romeria gracilis]